MRLVKNGVAKKGAVNHNADLYLPAVKVYDQKVNRYHLT